MDEFDSSWKIRSTGWPGYHGGDIVSLEYSTCKTANNLGKISQVIHKVHTNPQANSDVESIDASKPVSGKLLFQFHKTG